MMNHTHSSFIIYHPSFMKLDILAIGVHPDDVELSASGTLLRHIAQGKKVGLLDLTRGELGTRGNAQLRTIEAQASAQKMGAMVREQLDLADGFFQHTEANLLKIIQILRKYQPEIVLANAITDRHPDHGRAAKLVSEACFLSGLVKIETKSAGKIQAPWRPKNSYHYIQDRALQADLVVDVTEYMDKKLELIFTFKSQFYDPNSSEPMTPIASKDFIEYVRGRDSTYGRLMGVAYAEGFTVARAPGVNDLFDLK
jgi:N-acetylglucosamine malate deacetylase 1